MTPSQIPLPTVGEQYLVPIEGTKCDYHACQVTSVDHENDKVTYVIFNCGLPVTTSVLEFLKSSRPKPRMW